MPHPPKANASLAGEANAESADMGGLHDERSTAKSPLREVAYSRGASKYDNTPAQLTAPASGLFLERVFYDGDPRSLPLRVSEVLPRARTAFPEF